jgi:hypothetical protein
VRPDSKKLTWRCEVPAAPAKSSWERPRRAPPAQARSETGRHRRTGPQLRATQRHAKAYATSAG